MLAPAVLLLTALVPDGLKLPLGGAAALVFVPISFLLSQVGADFGKRLEKGLWRDWGGPPTTRFLRHGNHGFNEVTRGRVHEKLRELGLHVPTREEQAEDECAADKHYESIVAPPDAGPMSERYWANLIASGLTIIMACAAAPVASLLGILPRSYIFALAGLATLSSLQDAMEKSFSGGLRFGALVAFGVAATPFAFAGITSAFWAIVMGLLASLLVERVQLLAYWRGQETRTS